MRSFVGWSLICPLHPPANVRSLEMKKFYICSDVTHTHKHTTTTVLSCRILPTNILRDACHTHTHESLACTTLSHTALSHNTLSHTHTYTYTHTPVCRTQHRFSFTQHCRTQLCHTQVCFRQLTDAHHGYASMQYALSLTPSSLPIRLLPPSFFLTSPSHFSRLFPTF